MRKIRLGDRCQSVSSTAVKGAAAVLALFACGCFESSAGVKVETIDRSAVVSISPANDPLRLVIKVKGNGKLLLNGIETGRLSDPTEVTQRLKVIFEDREKSRIDEKSVLIDPEGDNDRVDLQRLIESLAAAKASPIEVIRDK